MIFLYYIHKNYIFKSRRHHVKTVLYISHITLSIVNFVTYVYAPTQSSIGPALKVNYVAKMCTMCLTIMGHLTKVQTKQVGYV